MAPTVSKRMQTKLEEYKFSRKSTFMSAWNVVLWMGLLSLGSLALAVVFWFPPSENSFYPGCLFRDFTGLNCPGCGGLRAWHELLHGRWLSALHMNALSVTMLPGLIIWCFFRRFFSRVGNDGSLRMTPPFFFLLAVMVVAFGVLRNIPWGPFQWLAP